MKTVFLFATFTEAEATLNHFKTTPLSSHLFAFSEGYIGITGMGAEAATAFIKTLPPFDQAINLGIAGALKDYPAHSIHTIASVFRCNLKTAVKDDKAMQGFDLESFLTRGEHSQKAKAPPIENDSGSKDCIDLSSGTAVFRFKNQPILYLQNTGKKLLTVEKPLHSKEKKVVLSKNYDLVDMEGYALASHITKPLTLIKVVSDFCEEGGSLLIKNDLKTLSTLLKNELLLTLKRKKVYHSTICKRYLLR